MDESAALDRLPTDVDDSGELFEHFERREFDGLSYHGLPDARHGLARGTVVVGDAVVAGYPSVPRVLALDAGLDGFFDAGDGPVAVEEKLNGFNVRVAAVGDRRLAFTRGGYACPFTTARARELLPLDAFFADHPDRMLCAELVGPETPYTDHDYEGVDSHAFRVFDVRDRRTGEPLAVDERRTLCESYGLAQPRLFGRADPEGAAEVVREAIAELDARGREGVVVRSADGTRLVKYTTRAQHHAELEHAFALPFDYGQDFLFSRVLREAFQSAAFDDADERRERARDLGESILLPMVETIERVRAGEPVGEEHTVRADPATVEALLDHLREQGLDLDIERDERVDGERVVRFRKLAASTRDRIDHYLSGGTYDE